MVIALNEKIVRYQKRIGLQGRGIALRNVSHPDK